MEDKIPATKTIGEIMSDRRSFVVAYSTGEADRTSKFAAWNDEDKQVMSHDEARQLCMKLNSSVSNQGRLKWIEAWIVATDHPKVVINPRTGYVRIV